MYTLKLLFTSGTRIKILNLFLSSSKRFHLREISRKIKTSPIYTSKELKKLEKIGLIRKEKLANLNLYSIDRNSKIITEMEGIFKKCK